jgi:hypothetical protein
MMKQLQLLLIILFCCSTFIFAQVIPEFRVNDIQGSAVLNYWNDPSVSISVKNSGGFIITWMDERNGNNDIYAQRYSSDGTALGNNFNVNDPADSTDHSTPSISTDSDGNFVITWLNDRGDITGIYAQRFSSDGTPLGNNFKVNDDPDSILCEVPSISMSKTGDFIISWNVMFPNSNGSNSFGDIYAQRFASDGTAIGPNFLVNDVTEGMQGKSAVSMDRNGNFVIAWSADWRSEGDNIYAQRYSSDGTALGSNFKVNDEAGYLYYSYSGPIPPSISADSSGNFVIAWTHNRVSDDSDLWETTDIYAQYYTSDGIALGGNFKVNDDIDSTYQYFSSTSMDDDGNFVIVWNDFRYGNYDIYAQRYARDGNKFGNNYLVTNMIDSLQSHPCVKLWNGKIYTAWFDNSGDGAGYDIWANVLDWDNPVGIDDRNMPNTLSSYKLSQNYPNPFNPSTTIRYNLPQSSYVTIEVYNITGQKIQTLLNDKMAAGSHQIEFNAQNLSSGVYFYRIEAGEFQDVKKMILIK